MALKPTLALGSWLAFRTTDDMTMVMGDLVLTDTEVNPVMKKLAEGGIEITALHNHLLRAQPAIFYMHILGHGDPFTLATTLHEALGASNTPLASAYPQSSGSTPSPTIDIDTQMIDQTLGTKGKAVGGVYQIGISRAETVYDGGMEVAATMGLAEAINFQPTGSGKAAITGDFVLTAQEPRASLPAREWYRSHGLSKVLLASVDPQLLAGLLYLGAGIGLGGPRPGNVSRWRRDWLGLARTLFL